MKKNGFSLLELIVVVIIIGILAGLALPLFYRTRERALDEEAKANLKLIQAAEKVYVMENGTYLGCSSIDCINENLRLSLPTSLSRAWDYSVVLQGVDNIIITATRRINNPVLRRNWRLDKDDEEPACQGQGCP
ncbi:MAG: prepilin-type N-terminal cleavage/methylation domain-containing protein [Candidatus Omnitrophica bacterium]|nr:prepilin-type N-terminal cleavage/methylation domain-containing protein [Candidatus Omnitrophota bacterium]